VSIARFIPSSHHRDDHLIDRAVGRRSIATIHHPSTRLARVSRVVECASTRRVRRGAFVARSRKKKKKKHPFVERSLARGRRASTLLTLEDEWTNARIDRVDAMTTR